MNCCIVQKQNVAGSLCSYYSKDNCKAENIHLSAHLHDLYFQHERLATNACIEQIHPYRASL
ncbi:MAG TPA: hypothetical protein VHP32_06825 [Ignavibacteria bacterium]|nr:hypothetical protein [Ignavibacteria bacterium]